MRMTHHLKMGASVSIAIGTFIYRTRAKALEDSLLSCLGERVNRLKRQFSGLTKWHSENENQTETVQCSVL